jgi:monoamine oxidase
MRVVVVGAGFAGMRCALRLRAQGADVVVLEGGHRPGGRVRTMSDPFIDGQYSESGAEWVDTIHSRLLELVDRYGLSLLGTGERWTVIRRWLHHGGQLMSPQRVREVDPTIDEQLERFESIVEAATHRLTDPSRPHEHPDAERLDNLSLADVAQQAGLGELAMLFKRRDSQGEFAAEPSQVSMLFVAQQRAHHRDAGRGAEVVAHRAAGGFSQVAAGLAAELGSHIEYGRHLTSVSQDADGVEVGTDSGDLQADHAVLACSLVPLRRVHFRTPMPAHLHAAVHGLGYGTITKTSVQWPERSWPAGYATTAGRAQRVYDPTIDQPGRAGILMAYCGGEGGHQWATMGEAERIALAADEMRSMHGIPHAPLGGWSRAWGDQQRYGGSYAVYEPGQVTAFWDVLRRPWGRVHLAGEHVATCTGYMEGALESGDTVADRLLGAR